MSLLEAIYKKKTDITRLPYVCAVKKHVAIF
jgi:hypothetical protein